jgi:multidrug efflux system membrane fusion protein
MRFMSLITAFIVVAVLYLIVFERDTVRQVAGGASPTILWSASKDTPLVNDAVVEEETQQSEVASQAPSETSNAPQLIKVVAIRSTAREIDSAVVLRGQTEAARSVVLRSETSGQVVNEPLRRGYVVSAGETLCELDPGTREANLADTIARLKEAEARVPETQARQDEAKARLEEAKINYNAADKLAQGGFASETRVASTQAAVRSAEATVESAKAGFDATSSRIQSAEAAVAAAQKEIERLTIKATFGGLLESDTAEIGSLLQPGSACATVIQLDPIKIVGFVPETERDRVTVGARAGARLLDGTEVTGNVTFLSRSADKLTRTFRVELEIPNPDMAIADGQTADILIASDGKLAHLIPQSSLTLNDAGALGVRTILAENATKFVEITLLRDTPNGVWVFGLDPDVNIIVVGQEYVVDGIIVEPTYQELGQ